MLKELVVMLFESVCHGDLTGHMRAWWEVARGRVTADEELTDDELDDIAGKIAMDIVGGSDDFQVLDLECRGKLTGDLLRAEKRAEAAAKCKS